MATKAQQKEADQETISDEDISGLNVYQRVARIAHEVGKVPATGRNPYKSAAISIEDTENAIRDLFARYHLVTNWSYTGPPVFGTEEKLWTAPLEVTVINADDPKDQFSARWYDNGGNPMAATSFARKGYYKALLHLAAESDETNESPGRQYARRPQAEQQSRPAENGKSSERANFSAPASDSQRAAINKLLRQSGRPIRLAGGDLTVGEASQIIQGLQKDEAYESAKFSAIHPSNDGYDNADVVDDQPAQHGKQEDISATVTRSDGQEDSNATRRYSQEQIDATMEANPAASDQAERLRERAASAASGVPKASPHKPASSNQIATIAKLARLLGEPEEPQDGMTSAEASDRITELSREYNERKNAR